MSTIKGNTDNITGLQVRLTELKNHSANAAALAQKAAEASDKAAVAATQNTTVCRELSTTTDKLRHTQDRIPNTMVQLEEWQPAIDSSVQSLEQSVKGLGARLTHLEISTPAAACENPGPDERRSPPILQGVVPPVSPIPEQSLGKGTLNLPRVNFEFGSTSDRPLRPPLNYHPDRGGWESIREFRMPKTSFPKFDGEHPKIWKENCEKYFTMFSVPKHYKAMRRPFS